MLRPPARTLALFGIATAVAAVAPAAAQDVTVSVVPSAATIAAGEVVTIQLAYANSDDPASGIASLNVALSVSGPGLPIVIGSPQFPDAWPITFGQIQTNLTPDGAGGFTTIQGARFGPGSVPVFNPPVLFRYDVLLPVEGVYSFTLSEPAFGPAVQLATASSFPFEPASTTLVAAAVTAGTAGACAPVKAYDLDARIDFGTRVTNDGNASARDFSIAIDAAAIDAALNTFDAVIRDPLGNAFDPAAPAGPVVTFADRGAFEAYVGSTLAQPGWSLEFTDPSVSAMPQVFPVSFAADQPALDAFAAALPEINITSPAPGAAIGPNAPAMTWSPSPVVGPAGLALIGTATADPAFGATETIPGLLNTADSTTFAGPFSFGGLDLAIDYASDPAAFAPLGLLTLAVDADCSASGQAEIDAVTLGGTARTAAATEVSVVVDPSCNPADIVDTFGVLDLADIDAFIIAFTAGDPLADIAEPFGTLDLVDVDTFIIAFLTGCPG